MKDTFQIVLISVALTAATVALSRVVNWIYGRDISKRWWRGFCLLLIIAFHVLLGGIVALFASFIVIILLELFRHAPSNWLLDVIFSITSMISVPIFFTDGFDRAYRDWKRGQETSQCDEVNRGAK